jgi:hypothetical protein
LDGKEHPDCETHHHINLLLSRLNEQQRRWFTAVLAEVYGLKEGGVRQMSRVSGISEKTIRRGLKDLDDEFSDCLGERIRMAGGGRNKKSR